MKINTLIYGLFVGILFCSCGDNDDASPSHQEKNWYVIEYDPNASDLDQLIYDIYVETGFPIFYNDTIGEQIRYDKGGNSYTYYEIFSPGYSYTASSAARYYSLERDDEIIRNAVEVLRDYVLRPFFKKEDNPNFNGKFGPHAFLLLDTLFTGSKAPDSLYWDLGILGLSIRYSLSKDKKNNFISIEQMTDKEKADYGWNIAMIELQRYYEKNYKERITEYYEIPQEAPEPDPNPSQSIDCYKLGSSFNIKNYNMDVSNPRKYGVLVFGANNGYSIYMPTQLKDLSSFTYMIYTKTDAEIREEHADYEMIIRRYEVLLQLLKDSGLTQFIKEQ